MFRQILRAAVLFFVAACGAESGEYCGALQGALDECDRDVNSIDDDIAACEERIKPCSAADEALMIEVHDCAKAAGFGVCADTTIGMRTDEDYEAVLQCGLNVTEISDACFAAAGSPEIFTTTFSKP